MSAEEAIEMLDNAAELKTNCLIATGGKPHIKLFKVLGQANDLGLATMLVTDASWIDDEIIEEMISSVDIARFILDYLGEERQDKARGGEFNKKTLQVIDKLSDSSVGVNLDVPVTPGNVLEMGNLTSLAIEHKVRSIRFALPPDYGEELCRNAIKNILETIQRYDRNLTYEGYRKLYHLDDLLDAISRCQCPAGKIWAAIGPDGTVRGCPFSSSVLGSVKETELKRIWVESQKRDVDVRCPMKCISIASVLKEVLDEDLLRPIPIRRALSAWYHSLWGRERVCPRDLPIWTLYIRD